MSFTAASFATAMETAKLTSAKKPSKTRSSFLTAGFAPSRRGRDATASTPFAAGAHLVKLLIESLPEGAVITGDAEVQAILSRDALAADVTFVVSIEKRPEIRKVFPPRGGGATSANTATTPRAVTGRGARTTASPTPRNAGATVRLRRPPARP